jgi:hypothetical protein
MKVSAWMFERSKLIIFVIPRREECLFGTTGNVCHQTTLAIFEHCMRKEYCYVVSNQTPSPRDRLLSSQ